MSGGTTSDTSVTTTDLTETRRNEIAWIIQTATANATPGHEKQCICDLFTDQVLRPGGENCKHLTSLIFKHGIPGSAKPASASEVEQYFRELKSQTR